MLYTLKDVFENRIFRIPGYQRGYSWDHKELEQLWIDIKNVKYPYPTDSFHFTGFLTLNSYDQAAFERLSIENHLYQIQDNSVIIAGNKYIPFHLVDGQQRLTSLLILLSLLIDAIISDDSVSIEDKENARQAKTHYLVVFDIDNTTKHIFGYERDVPSHHYLLKKIFDDLTIEGDEPETLYTNRLSMAKTYYLGNLLNIDGIEKLRIFSKITERLLFAILILNNGNDDRHTIDVSMAFETLNFRGKQLSNLELFKNRILYLISKTTYTSDAKIYIKNKIIETWLIIYKWLGRKGRKEIKDDEFLKAFWLVRFSNFSMVNEEFKNWINYIFKFTFSIEKEIEDNIYLWREGNNNVFEWLNLMQKAIEMWFIIKNPTDINYDNDDTQFNLTTEITEYLVKINAFPNGLGNYMQSLILSVFLRLLPTKENMNEAQEDSLEHENKLSTILDLLKQIERHNYACFILNGNKTNFNREKIYRCNNYYYSCGLAIASLNSTTSPVNLSVFINKSLTNGITRRNILTHIHRDNRFYDWIGIKYLLIHWEFHLARINKVEINIIDLFSSIWNVKLIYPDRNNPNIRTQFPEINSINISNRDRFSYSLGNIFISRNNRYHNSFLNLKNNIYNDVAPSFNEKELLNYNTWNQNDIIRRGEQLFTFAIQNWELGNAGDLNNPENYRQREWEEILLG